MKFEFCLQIFEKRQNIKFNENAPIVCRVVQCGWTDGHTDMTKLIVAFLNFVNAPKTSYINFRYVWKENLIFYTCIRLRMNCNNRMVIDWYMIIRIE